MKNKRFAIVVLAMAAVLFLPLVSNADEFWFFYFPAGPTPPFADPGTAPARSFGLPGSPVNVINTDGFTITLQAFSPTTGDNQLDSRSGSDENGVGIGNGTYVEADSTTYEVNGGEYIKVVFPNNVPLAASEHLFFNSLEGGDVAAIWKDDPFVPGNLLGTITEAVLPEPHDFQIPASAFGHDIFVTADPNTPGSTILLNSASVDQIPEPTTMFLLGSGLLGFLGLRKKFRR